MKAAGQLRSKVGIDWCDATWIADRVLRHIDLTWPAMWGVVPRSARAMLRTLIISAIREASQETSSCFAVMEAMLEASDPAMLKKRIADLEDELARRDIVVHSG